MFNQLKNIYWKLAKIPFLGKMVIYYAPLFRKYALKIDKQNSLRKFQPHIEKIQIEKRLQQNYALSLDITYQSVCTKISVIINTCNRAHQLTSAIESVLVQYYPNFELICVNGPSTDNTQSILESYGDKLTILNCPLKNLSMSRNIGILAAKGEIVAFIDDDAVARPDWLMELAGQYTDNQIGAVGGFVHDETGISWQARICIANRYGEANYYDDMKTAIKAEGVPESWKKKKFFSPIGVNVSFNRKALLEIGGFDENFFWHLDETDVLLRLNDIGYQIKYASRAEVTHKFAESNMRRKDKTPISLYHQARSKTYFVLKHAAPWYGKVVVEKRLAAYLDWLRAQAYEANRQGKIDNIHLDRLLKEIGMGEKSARKIFNNLY